MNFTMLSSPLSAKTDRRQGWIAQLLFAFLIGLTALQPPVLAQTSIIWTDVVSGNIHRADLLQQSPDNIPVANILRYPLETPLGIAIDNRTKRIFWANAGENSIQCSDLLGNNIQTVINIDGVTPFGIAIDQFDRKLYWTDVRLRAILRANLDGSSIETVVSESLVAPRAVKVDEENGIIYWTDIGTDKIQYVYKDSKKIHTLVSGLNLPWDLDIDYRNERIYWTDAGNHCIQRTSFHGGKVETVLRHLPAPHGLAIDNQNGTLYWTDDVLSQAKIMRADLDGRKVQALILFKHPAKPLYIDHINLGPDVAPGRIAEETAIFSHKNFPNPFNPSTRIEYTLPEAALVTVSIYNTLGQLIRTLVREQQSDGSHSVTWDGTGDFGNTLPSGAYFYHITAGEFSAVKQILLLK